MIIEKKEQNLIKEEDSSIENNKLDKREKEDFVGEASPNNRYYTSKIKKEVLEIKRVVKVTKGGRRFSFTSLILIKDEEKKSVAFGCAGGKEVLTAIRKSSKEAQKKLTTFFPKEVRTIPRDITVKYKATKIFLKPTKAGSGVKAGGILNTLFKFLEINDVSAKIIGSKKNKNNVIKAAFKALNELTGKKYDY